jgi:hypothetical protein
VVGMFVVLEVVNNMFLEPWLYGRNVGVSDAAAIVAVAFWTWLWGPIGLVLAFPLTVCLVVIGRFVPFLKFFDTLLSDRPALAPHVGFYQRLLARDRDEAAGIAQEQLKQSSLEAVCDDVLVPALSFGRHDHDSDLIGDEELKSMLASVSLIAAELVEQSKATAATQSDDQATSPDSPPAAMLACPARDETDEAALQLLAHLIDPDKCTVQVLASSLLANEVAALVEQDSVKLICIGAVPPGGLAHVRYLCKRLRACCPDAKIVVGRWGVTSLQDADDETLRAAGADYVVTSLAEARNQILSLVSVVAAQRRQEEDRLETEAARVRQSA